VLGAEPAHAGLPHRALGVKRQALEAHRVPVVKHPFTLGAQRDGQGIAGGVELGPEPLGRVARGLERSLKLLALGAGVYVGLGAGAVEGSLKGRALFGVVVLGVAQRDGVRLPQRFEPCRELLHILAQEAQLGLVGAAQLGAQGGEVAGVLLAQPLALGLHRLAARLQLGEACPGRLQGAHRRVALLAELLVSVTPSLGVLIDVVQRRGGLLALAPGGLQGLGEARPLLLDGGEDPLAVAQTGFELGPRPLGAFAVFLHLVQGPLPRHLVGAQRENLLVLPHEGLAEQGKPPRGAVAAAGHLLVLALGALLHLQLAPQPVGLGGGLVALPQHGPEVGLGHKLRRFVQGVGREHGSGVEHGLGPPSDRKIPATLRRRCPIPNRASNFRPDANRRYRMSRTRGRRSSAEMMPTILSSCLTNTRWMRPVIIISATSCTAALDCTANTIGVMMSPTVSASATSTRKRDSSSCATCCSRPCR
jgi:hypothetical protein